MTRIALFLTAVPLAAVLAHALNRLLDRRLAALQLAARRAPRSALRRGLSIALALALSMSAAPLLAETGQPACTSIDCSLMADASRVNELWKRASNDRAVVVTRSRIPMSDSLRKRLELETGNAGTGEDQRSLSTEDRWAARHP